MNNGMIKSAARGANKTVHAHVTRTANQTIADNTTTEVVFTSKRVDSHVMFMPSRGTRLTCVSRGLYLITAGIRFDGNATGYRLVRLRKNGSVILRGNTLIPGAATSVEIHISAVIELAAGDYVEVQVIQNSGGNLDVAVVANVSPEFSITKIG